MRGLPLLFLLAAAATAPAARAEPAPMPPHWTAEADEAGYRPAAPVRGFYAHGISGPMNWRHTIPGRDIPPCAGDEAARAAYAARAGAHAEEFWFYATAAQGVLFTRRLRFADPARPCAEGVRHSYAIDRAYVADGMVHYLSMNREGDMVASETMLRTATDFSVMHQLMARPTPRRGERSRRRVAGHAATCWTRGAHFFGDQLCLSQAPGAAHGMIVSASSIDDVQTLSELEVDVLRPNVTLDPRLFETQRLWRTPERD